MTVNRNSSDGSDYYQVHEEGEHAHGHRSNRGSSLLAPRWKRYSDTMQKSFVDTNVVHERTQTSAHTIFALWNSMTGPAAIVLPYAFGQAGILMGIAMIIATAAISNYTCQLVIRLSEENDDFAVMSSRYLGKYGQIIGFIFSILSLAAAGASNFNMMSDSFFYIIAAFIEWGGGSKMDINDTGLAFFSITWVTIILGVAMFALSMIKKPTMFIRLLSFGALFAIAIDCFVIFYGVYGISQHSHRFKFQHGGPDDVVIKLYDSNWSLFASILGLGFICQNNLMIVLRSQKNPEHNGRDVRWTYYALMASYVVTSLFGYLGFAAQFSDLEQDCLNNFSATNAFAFVMRMAIIFQTVFVTPVFTYFTRVQFFAFFAGNEYPSVLAVATYNVLFTFFTMAATLFLPTQLATIMSYGGVITGIVITFIMPGLCWATHRYRLWKDNLSTKREFYLSAFIGIAVFVVGFCLLYLQFILQGY